MREDWSQPLDRLQRTYGSESVQKPAPSIPAQHGWSGVRALPAVCRTIVALLALLSVAAGVWKGARQTQDFQWSGAHLAVQHVDPWAEALTHGFDGAFGQAKPNYLPLLYVLLAPFGELSEETARLLWAVTNVIFAVTSALLIARFCGLRGSKVGAGICLFLLATPTRNCIGNGQQSLLVLMLWAVAMRFEGSTRKAARWMQPLLLGASFFKFTFAPPVLLFVLFRRGLRAALLTLAPAVAGTLAVWLWLFERHDAGSLLTLCREPFAVAERGYTATPADPNLMNVVEFFLAGRGLTTRTIVEGAAALLACVAICAWMFKSQGPTAAHQKGIDGGGGSRADSVAWQMSMLALVSFALFKHHGYDGVVLLFPFCYALRHWTRPVAKVLLALLAWPFYVERLLDAVYRRPAWFCLPDLLLLCSALVLTVRLRAKSADPADRSYWEVDRRSKPVEALSA